MLDLASDKAGWERGASAPGRALGLALRESFGSVVAQVAEVSLQHGVPRVHRVTCVIDCGTVVNPEIVAQKMEGRSSTRWRPHCAGASPSGVAP